MGFRARERREERVRERERESSVLAGETKGESYVCDEIMSFLSFFFIVWRG